MDLNIRFSPLRSHFIIAVLVVSIAGMSGCAEKDWGYVTGTITLDGAPIGPGTILFQPTEREDTTTRAAVGYFEADGKYTLKSAGGMEGAQAGEYLVTVHGGSQEAFSDEQSDPKTTTKIPARYRENGTSDLKATVKPGKQTIDFDLKL